MAAHNYWRVRVQIPAGATYTGIAEIELRETVGGTDVTGSATVTAETTLGSNGPARAVDGATGTWWVANGGTTGSWFYIQFDFTGDTPRDIAETHITTPNSLSVGIDGVEILYSDNGSDFTVTDTFTGLDLAPDTSHTYAVTGAGGGGGGEDTPSTRVTRGSSVMASGEGSLTLTEGVDFTLSDTASTKWFARITNTRHSGMGDTNNAGNQNADDFMTHVTYSGDDVVFVRPGTANDNRIDWEIIEYIGPTGGANEWIVRERGVKAFNSELLNSYANPGSLASASDALIWITGQSTDQTGRDGINSGTFMARFNGSNFELERRIGNADGDVSYAIIEYTGANWSVQHQEFDDSGNDYDGTISPALSDFAKTIHHAQSTYGSGTGGLDDIAAASEIQSNTVINFLGQGDSTNRRHSIWFLSNDNMIVQRLTGTMAGTGEEEVEDFAVTAVTLNETSVVGSSDSTGSGTAFPRGFINYTLVDATTLRLRQSDNGQTSRFSITVFSWPQDAASSGESRSASIMAASTVSAARTISRTRSSSITATSAVSASGTRKITRSAAVVAVSGASATGKRSIKRSAAVSGVSATTTARAITRSRSASLAATSAVSAIAGLGASRSSSIAAASSVRVLGFVRRSRSASVAAVSAVSASAGITRQRSASVSALSEVAASAVVRRSRSSSIIAQADVTAERRALRNRAASIVAVSSVNAGASSGISRSSSISATSSVAAIATVARKRSAAVLATSSLSTFRSRTVTRSASVAATSTVAANAQTAGTAVRSAEVSATSTLTTNRVVVRSRTASAASASVISSNPRRRVRRSAQVAASSQVSSLRTVTRRRSASIATGSVVGSSAVRRVRRTSLVSAASTVSATYVTSAPPLANPVRTIRAEHQDRVIRVAAQDRSISSGTQERVIRSPAQDRSIRVASQARSIRAPAQNRTIIAS